MPISALKGHNVVAPSPGWCGYQGPSLLQLLEQLPATPADAADALALPVQWVEKFSSSADTSQGRRVFWGRVAQGSARAGDTVQVLPGGHSARIAQVLDHARRSGEVAAGRSAGIVLDRELDVSRGDWLVLGEQASTQREAHATVAWMDDEPLVAGRTYWALHGHRWVKTKVRRVHHRLDIHTLAEAEATQLEANAIGHAELVFQDALPLQPFARSRRLGAMVLVDAATHKTAGAVLVREPQ